MIDAGAALADANAGEIVAASAKAEPPTPNDSSKNEDITQTSEVPKSSDIDMEAKAEEEEGEDKEKAMEEAIGNELLLIIDEENDVGNVGDQVVEAEDDNRKGRWQKTML